MKSTNSSRTVLTGVALALLGAAALLVGCSKEESDDPVIVVTGGGSANNAGSSAGGSANNGGSGGAEAGTDSGGSGGDGGSGGAACEVPGQVPTMGVCMCPPFKPTECSTGCADTMKDVAHCGGCEMPCAAGAACSDGLCTAAPTEVATLTGCMNPRMVLSDGVLYIADSGTGTISSVAVAQGSTPMALVTGETMPGAIAVDANGIYWATGDISTEPPGAGAIRTAPLTGGAATDLIVLDEASRGIAVADDMVFFAHQGEIFKIPTAPAAGGADAGAATGEYIPYMCTAEDVDLGRTPIEPPPESVPGAEYVCSSDESCTEGGKPAAMATNGTQILFVIKDREGVEMHSVDGTATGDYLEMGESQGSLMLTVAALDATHGYWGAGDHVQRASIAMGKADQALVIGTIDFDAVTGFAITSTHAYISSAAGKITRGALATVGPDQVKEPVATDQVGASNVVSDGTNVYWINRGIDEDMEVVGDCKIMTVPIAP